ncbi:hypothetical protein [Mastigocoleus testarum]|uniref:SPOR domain-containing protein n=1 Tax=Mastigocoleus testarum BC008 TaxID=371196 RepID=A0A0V7ZRQ2_9CYAN|nr:hypothetical protein [Mastigocoleus testarum]KST67293.1 hypothetical protein BC008_29335 [Mastigocoleus testarum BC008]
MRLTVSPKLQTIPIALAVSICSGTIGFVNMTTTLATEKIPVCRGPRAGEYLLLVSSPTKDNRTQLRQVLPPRLKLNVCKYLSGTVTRIGGFARIDDANRWARYIRDSAGLNATITTRPGNRVARTTTKKVSYKPRQLGEGFAVLVDYRNRPQIASSVRKLIKSDVGFVSYGQRPYLLAAYTNEQKEAYSTLQKLSDKGYFAIIADSRKVMLLRPAVRLP